MITLFQLLDHYGINTNTIRLIRHGNKEIPILDVYRNSPHRLETYQRFQDPNKFGDAKSILVFAPYHNTSAILLGMWDITGYTPNSDLNEQTADLLLANKLPASWIEKCAVYDLESNPILDDLSERMIIEWGRATVSWVQKLDKEIIQIRPRNAIGDFESFSDVRLNFNELCSLVKHPESNISWKMALSSVNGIYIIQDTESGKLYVGSAYGNYGIFGRWQEYARTGHGGNKLLKEIDPNNFIFSVLEIISPTATADDVIELENRWKDKLGTRKYGLNEN